MSGQALLVDSHCHLNYEGLTDDIPGVLARARGAGVGWVLTVNTRLEEADALVAIAHAHPGVFASVGVHPHEAEHGAPEGVDALVARTADPLVVGIGETGLDYYYEHAPRAAQQESFLIHIAAAQETGLPLIVHSREAEEDTAALIRKAMAARPFRFLLHCFTGSRRFMEEMVELGAYVSLSGIVTFKNARDLQETARHIPDERLLVETDSPYLAPVPHRGKRCEPAFVADTARHVAALRETSLEALARLTTANFFTLFTKAAECRGHGPILAGAVDAQAAGTAQG